MAFIRFIFECFINAIGYVVGDVYASHEVHSRAIHGMISGLLFVVVSLLLIKLFCLDYEGYPKKSGCILLSIISAAVIAFLYLAIVFWIGYRVP